MNSEPRVVEAPPVIVPPDVRLFVEPVTVKLPVRAFTLIPFTAPLAVMLWKVKAPLMLESEIAVPVVEVIVLPAPVTLTVPPPVALKPVFATEVIDTLEKLKVPPGLVVRFAPLPADAVSPVKVNVPEVFERLTPVPVVVVTVTLFWTSAPVIVPVFVKPVDAPVLISSELTVSLFPPSVTVPVRIGFVPEAIVSPLNVNVEPWPQSV